MPDSDGDPRIVSGVPDGLRELRLARYRSIAYR